MSILKIKDSQGNWVGVPTVKGDTGNGIQSAVLNNDYTLTLTFTDGTTYTTPSIRGEKGEQGEPAIDMDIHICSASEYDAETRIPTIANPNDKTFYLVPTEDGTSPDLFTEWVYVNNAWEMFGSMKIDLSGYLTDVTVDGTSVVTDGVAEIPIASETNYGLIKALPQNANAGINIERGYIMIANADNKQIKEGANASRKPIVPTTQHISTFYGLAKASGTDEKNSTLPVGQYTDEAKSSIQDMLDVPSNADLNEVEEKVDQNTEDLLKAFPIETVSGSIVSFEDGANGIPLQSLVVDINPVQDLHGQDAPYPAGGGKNKITATEYGGNLYSESAGKDLKNLVDVQDYTENGNVITVNVETAWRGRLFATGVLPAGDYHVHFETTEAGTRATIYVTDADLVVERYIANKLGTGTTSTSVTLTDSQRIAIIFANNQVGTVTVTNLQVESGSSYTAWSPYENICPISGWTGMQLQKTRANILNPSANPIWGSRVYTLNQDGSVTQSGNDGRGWTSNAFTGLFLKKGQYILSFTAPNITCNLRTSIDGYTENYRTTNSVLSFTLTEDCIVKWKTSLSSYPVTYAVQLEVGTEATAYVPYTGRTIPISWQTEAGTVYGGKLDVLSGVLTVDKASFKVSDVAWTRYGTEGSYKFYHRPSNIKAGANTRTNGSISSAYPVVPFNDLQNTPNMFSDSANSTGRISVHDSEYTSSTVEEFVAGRADVRFVYPLATPIEIQLDAHTLNSIYGQNNIWADSGDTDVEYRADPDLYIQRKMPKVPVDDVQINGTSIVNNGVANVPVASANNVGVVKILSTNGIYIDSNNTLAINKADTSQIKNGAISSRPIVPANQSNATFYGLAKAAGDTTQSQSSNAVGVYTDEAKSKIQNMLGITDKYSPKEWVAESETELVTNAHSVGDLFYIGETLYKVIADLNAGDAINVGVNVEEVDVNNILTDYATKQEIENNINIVEKSASGAVASFSDGADDIPLKSLIINIDPVQDLHGYDSPWVGGGGKNLCPPLPSQTANGITITTDADGVSHISGTVTSTKDFMIELPSPINGTFTFSANNSVALSGTNTYFDLLDSNNNSLGCSTLIYANRYRTVTGEIAKIKIRFQTGLEIPNGFTVALQLEEGSTATDYVPYENICPISGWTEINAYNDPLYGGNIEWNQLVNSYRSGSTNGLTLVPDANNKSISISGTITTAFSFDTIEFTRNSPVKIKRDGRRYIIICNQATPYPIRVAGFADCVSVGSYGGVFSNYISGNQEFTNTLAFHAKVGDTFAISNFTVQIFDLTTMFGTKIADYIYSLEQANVGAGVAWFKKLFPKDYYEYNAGEKTTVSAVNGKPYTHVNIQLGQTVYGGKLDVLSGMLRADKGIYEADGSDDESIVLYSGNRFEIRNIPNYKSPVASIKDDILCNRLKVIRKSAQGSTIGVISGSDVDSARFMINVGTSTVAETKTWLSENPLTIVYPLATPITIQLTPNQINSLLGVNNLWADSGDTEVEYFSQVDEDLIDYIKANLNSYAKKELLNNYVDDVQIDGTSIVENGIAEIPFATSNAGGVVKIDSSLGIKLNDTNKLLINRATTSHTKAGLDAARPIVPICQHESVFYGLAKASGDTTQASSSNAVGTYTESAKSAISDMLNGAIQISGTDPTITAKSGIRYVCGEILSLNFTPSVNGICDVMFTSGSTPTVLTLPNTVKMPEWFSIEANTTYEINIADGIYGVVTSWTL